MYESSYTPSAIYVDPQIGTGRLIEFDAGYCRLIGERDLARRFVGGPACLASELNKHIISPAVDVVVRSEGHGIFKSCEGLGEADALRWGYDVWLDVL